MYFGSFSWGGACLLKGRTDLMYCSLQIRIFRAEFQAVPEVLPGVRKTNGKTCGAVHFAVHTQNAG